jgi:ATP phosphoribosyltransferase
VLLVRAADIPEYVHDGVVDCGITGIDLVRESGAVLHELLPLGFGSCRLEAGVATVYPRLTRALLPFDVTLVDVSGSVEIAPRLGLADAIVDLVSSGSTLRTNGLRSLGALLESEAVLVARDDPAAAPFAAMLRAVVDARRHRYVMLNAPESALTEITGLLAPRVPSVLPLAEPGMVAVHALVHTADVWQLLPRLEAAGGSSILIVPVERMAA